MSFPWYNFGNGAGGRTTKSAPNRETASRVWGANYARHGEFVPWRATVTAIQAFVALAHGEQDSPSNF
ncbi:MAG: hypothetical protein EXR77_11900 [Myxococcales bacterium]|nr:hypothetical protein [Myxococcales bacterium]